MGELKTSPREILRSLRFLEDDRVGAMLLNTKPFSTLLTSALSSLSDSEGSWADIKLPYKL